MLILMTGCDGPPSPMKARASLVGHAGAVVSVAFSPDGKTLASRSSDSVKLWEVVPAKESASFAMDGSDQGSVAFSPDGKTLAMNLGDDRAVARDLASKQVVATYTHDPKPAAMGCYSVTYGWGLAYSPDGKTLAGGGSHSGEDGFVTIWDLAGGGKTTIDTQSGPVTGVAFSPDGRSVAAIRVGGRIGLWDLASKTEQETFPASNSFLAPFAFSPDGLTIASVGEGRTVELWDVASGDSKARMKEHLKGVLSLAYHPNGRVIASGDSDGSIFLWDLAARRARVSLVGHQGKVWALAFSPDGKTLASGGEDKVVRLWDVAKAVEGLSKRE